MFRTVGGGGTKKFPHKDIPEGPVQDFFKVIDKTPEDEWEKRTNSFSTLVNEIPTGDEYYDHGETWYNSPVILRHLAYPLSDLLKDARSTVVKRTCESCTELFNKCQDNAKYLLKDIMPTILDAHRQTVAVIRNYVQTMTLDALAVCPCKMAMTLWLDKMKSDKSSTVREACALYLGVGLQEWTEEGYLTDNVYNQVGLTLVKALQDSAPAVRANAKKALETIQYTRPDIMNKLASSGDVMRDTRIRKVLKRIQAGESMGDDISTTSSRMGSVHSRGVNSRSGGIGSGPIRNAKSPPYGSYSRTTEPDIPETIGVGGGSRITYNSTRKGGLGPPVRMPTNTGTTTPTPFHTTTSSGYQDEEEDDDAIFDSPHTASPANSNPDLEESFVSVDTASDLPVIANVNDLRETAKMRSNRRTTLLQQRLTRSNSNVTDDLREEDGEGFGTTTTTTEPISSLVSASEPSSSVTNTATPEHVKIAEALLGAHKQHVDQIMETLKVEMDALKDFENLLLAENNNNKRPTEDDVLQYYESVDLCLEARTRAGSILQKKLDKISQSE